MTEIEQRIAIAEVVGVDADYPNDLNAMREAEKTLSLRETGTYIAVLNKIRPPSRGYPMYSLDVHASAPQKAEAFLRTIGKWKD